MIHPLDRLTDPYLAWAAVHFTPVCTNSDPTISDWRMRLAIAIDSLNNVTVDNTSTTQTMEPAKYTTQAHGSTTINTIGQYPTTIRSEAVAQIKGALSLEHPDTHNAHRQRAFTADWNFPTDRGMVPQVSEPTLPPTVQRLPEQPRPWHAG